jgi:hypothetical protein
MTILQIDYNTQRDHLRIAEYGRHIQEYVAHIQSIADKDKRTQWVHNLVNIMATLNPEIKLQANYKEILWGHIFQIGQYQLDVDSPYPSPTSEVKSKKPETIGYPTTNIRFRFYGRNLQMMVDKVSEMQDPELRQEMVNLIASFMYNSCKIWNNENLSNEVIADHLKILSKGQLQLEGSEITVTADASNFQPKKFFKNNTNGGFNRNKNNNNNKKNQNRGKNYRRY